MASIDRTAYPRFKRVVSAHELTEAVTPTQDEVAWARGKTQSDPHLLAPAVRLKAYQRLGYFPKLRDIPAVVVDTVRGVLDLPDEVGPETGADRTAKRRRGFVRAYLGVKYEAVTNKAEAFHGYAEWLMIGGKLMSHNDPDHLERVVKFNELLANCAIYSAALDITDVANGLAADGYPVDTDDLATITPYIQHTIRRMGDLMLNLAPPDHTPVTRLDLEPRVLFGSP
ncbi:Tn3 family transposase [Nocardia sp. NPDC058497]|uniref:Tn3 family transposase n=1 Tax=Nocardia sp. NPDC058497 TaxID=3346529 RepID=UPI0036548AE1